MTDRRPQISIVVPAFNEERRLERTLARIGEWMDASGMSYEVLVVDDGSTDGTRAIAEKFARERPQFTLLPMPGNRGKGAAVRAGFEKSRGEIVLFSDADLSTPIEELERLRGAFRNGAGFVIASRGLKESNLEVRQEWFRERMGKTFNALVRSLTGIPFRDTQCGFKLLRGDDARALAAEMREEGFAFDVELILLARRRGIDIREVPVTWRNDSRSRVDPVEDAWRMLWALPRILGRTGRYRA
ncbi:MAG TPA: dolichyl-phosphate beta-glucosyltransferase [bacterium]|nr:dolichyl-phosphate beta-glucosyltransferase [bacterium]